MEGDPTPAVAAARLLWAACRPEPDRTGVAEAIDAGADLDLAAISAIGGGVGPMLWRALEGRASDEPWADLLSREAARRRAQTAFVVAPSLPLALEPLRAAHLEPVLIKGGALFERYPAPGLRPMDDIDVLLPSRDHDRAVAALAKAGWRPIALSHKRAHARALTHPKLPGFALDLHWDLGHLGQRANRLTGDELWRARRPALFGGVPAFGLNLEEELVLLAAHAGKPFHYFNRLMWVVDIVVAMQTAAAGGRFVDWDRLAGVVDRVRCSTVMAVGLHQARRLGAEVPDALTEPAARGVRRRALEPLLSEDWPVVGHEGGVRERTRLALVDDRRYLISIVVGDVFKLGARRAPAQAFDIARRGVKRWWNLHTAQKAETPTGASAGRRP